MNHVMQELFRISQEAAQATTPQEQVQTIVDAISRALAIDVCSLYLENTDGDMILQASHGLVTRHPIIIPRGKGLVGLVARLRRTMNLSDPEAHTEYYYVPQSHEEQFHSFCGVPLVRRGEVIGVLVVQSRKPEKLDSEHEAFLATLASHLALIVPPVKERIGAQASRNLHYQGINGAPGVAIGRVKPSRAARLEDIREHHGQDSAQEMAHWQELKVLVSENIRRERAVVAQNLGESLASILDAYDMLLHDPGFSHKTECHIYDGHSVLTAVKHSVRHFAEQFKQMDDAYLRARFEDIEHLGDKIYQVWLGRESEDTTDENGDAMVLVGNQISVSDIVSLSTESLSAIVCSCGAALSHIAIFANALGIPAVMGVGDIKTLREGETIIVDGNAGEVIIRPSDNVLSEYQNLIHTRQDFAKHLRSLADLPALTTDGERVTLLANSGLQADVMPGLHNGAEGIGLFRTEIPFMMRSSLPSEDEQFSAYAEVFRAYAGKPVYIRTLDIGGDKPLPYLPVNDEENPALGWRGVRFTLDNLPLLMTQLRAIVRAAAGDPKVHILLPMISSTAELDRCHRLLDDACQQLLAEGYTIQRPKLGVMLEVPAVISLLPFWRNKLDFVSIGSNDLSQYLLAIDRGNTQVGGLYDALHPSVIHELHRVVNITRQMGLPLSVCGEMASDPIAVILLMGLGYRHLSMSAAKLPLIKWIIRSIAMEDAELFAQQALKIDDAKEIRRIGKATLMRLGIDLENV